MARNNNHAPRSNQGNEQNPGNQEIPETPFDDYVEGRPITPERREGQGDPAARAVADADYVQRSLYEVHPNIDQQAFYEPNSAVPGGYETLKVISEMRNEGRNVLLPSEESLMKHMRLVGDRYRAEARLDFAAIQAAHPDLSIEEAQKAAAQEMLDELKTQRDAALDDREKSMLTMNIQTMQSYLDMFEGPINPDNKLYAKMLQADYRAQKAEGDKKAEYESEVKDLSKKVREQDKPMNTVTSAYRILAKKYGKEPVGNGAEMPLDSRLEYVDPQETAAREAEEAARKAAEKQLHAAEIAAEESELAGLREEIANKTMLKSAIHPEKYERVQKRYRELCKKQAERKYPLLKDPNVSDEAKIALATTAVIEEQNTLRSLKNEKIKNTTMAKVCRWVGRHKVLVVGGSMILAPVTGGISLAAGAAIGAGIYAGAKVDESIRKNGLRSADKAINQAEFISRARKEIASRRADGDGKKLGYGNFHNWGMESYSNDMRKLRAKHLGSAALVGAGFSVGIIAPGLMSTGLDRFMWGHAAGLRPWVYGGVGAAAAMSAGGKRITKLL